MLKTILKAIAYSQLPKTTFALSHPKKAAKLAKTGWDLKHAWAPRLAAVGVGLVALPVGYAIGRITTRTRNKLIERALMDDPIGPLTRSVVLVDGDARTELVGRALE